MLLDSTWSILIVYEREEFPFSIVRNQLYEIGPVFKVKINFIK